jgi:hypothetical protein
MRKLFDTNAKEDYMDLYTCVAAIVAVIFCMRGCSSETAAESAGDKHTFYVTKR